MVRIAQDDAWKYHSSPELSLQLQAAGNLLGQDVPGIFDRYVHWKRLDPNDCMGSLGTRCRLIMAEKLEGIAV